MITTDSLGFIDNLANSLRELEPGQDGRVFVTKS